MIIREIAERLQPRVEDLCRELLPNGKLRGHEWVCGDITGAPGDSLSVELRGDKAGVWYDHATREGGDVIDLIDATRQLHGVGHAAKWGAKWLGIPDSQLNGTNGHAVTADVFDPLKFRHRKTPTDDWRTGTAAWEYRDASGAIIGWVVRFDDPPDPDAPTKPGGGAHSGGKRILPIRLIDGKPHWKGWKKPELRPIYGIHRLSSAPPDAPLLIVEGEKTADAARKLFPNDVVLTPMGGTGSFSSSADWGPVIEAAKTRTTRLWPDADKAGRSAMTYLKARIPSALVVDTSGLPDGWDLADPVPDGVSIQGLYDAAGSTPAPSRTAPAADPFRVLGMLQGELYIHSLSTGDIIHFLPTALTEMNLQLLADDEFWKAKGYTTSDEQAVDYKAIAKMLIAKAKRLGVFNPDCVRGRGCWLDDGRVVYHAGDRLYVDGVLTPLHDFNSRHIYIAKTAIAFKPDVVLTATQGELLCEACNLLPWSPKSHSWTLPSFLFLSHICGVLGIRPHGWLVGGQGSGKSYTCSNVIDPLIGPASVKALSGSTAPGIRQAVGCDAVAVFGDEFEAKDQQTRDRIRAITELGRQAYVETGWATLHGTAGGDGRQYRTRSMFFFSSIAASVLESADLARFVVLEFQKRDDPAAFELLKAKLLATVGQPGFAEAFAARAVKFAPLILKAIDVFRKAIQKTCGDARKADTFGTLAGGRSMLCSDTLPTLEQAEQWAAQIDWENEGAGSSRDSDPSRVVEIILQHNHRVQDADGRYQDMTVGEMMATWIDKDPSTSGLRKACFRSLMSIGIHPITQDGKNYIDIAKVHQELSKIFRNTPYGDLYQQYLKREPINGQEARYTPKGAKTLRAIRVEYTTE